MLAITVSGKGQNTAKVGGRAPFHAIIATAQPGLTVLPVQSPCPLQTGNLN